MVDDRASPSAGWREVSHEMGVDTDVEEPTRACPDCGRQCENVFRDVYECEKHGVLGANDADYDDESGRPNRARAEPPTTDRDDSVPVQK